MSTMNPKDGMEFFVQAATIARTTWTLFDDSVDSARGVFRLPDEYILDLLVLTTMDEVPDDPEFFATLFDLDPNEVNLFFWRPGNHTKYHLGDLYLAASGNVLEVSNGELQYLAERIERCSKNQVDIVTTTEYDKARYRKETLPAKTAHALITRQESYNSFFGEEIITPLEAL